MSSPTFVLPFRPYSASRFGPGLLALALLATACGDDRPPPPAPTDGGRRDGGNVDGGDGGGADVDGGPVPDGGPLPDGAGVDGAMLDGGTDSGIITIFEDAGLMCPVLTDRCRCPAPGTPCGPGDSCPAGTTCLDNTCGERRCLVRGGVCETNADCPATSTCMITPEGGVCVRGSAGCADSRECPRGFACEGGGCVDRRVPCVAQADCPYGFTCALYESQGYLCEYLPRACSTATACGTLDCLDVDGDGERECGEAGTCETNTDCSGGNVCGTDPEENARCGGYGPCTGTCSAGYTCVDLWGDGQRECVPTGGSCTSTAMCPPRQVCAPPYTGGPPRCFEGNDGTGM